MLPPRLPLLPLLPLLLVTLSHHTTASAAAASCATGFHMIVARAALEAPGQGSTGTLARDIIAKVPGSDSVALSYPALSGPFYQNSLATGVKHLKADIASYRKACPDTGIVLLGYDQGAYVVGDVLGGAGVNGSGAVRGADAEAIKGIILLSDPAHVPGQPYDAGTAKKSGKYPRSAASLKKMSRFSSVMKSYCDKGDTVCASGNNAEANRGYLDNYQDVAADFISGLYRG